MQVSPLEIQQAVSEFFKIGAIAGFIAAFTILINLNYKGFHFLFKDNTKKYWWLFIIICVIPFLVIVYVFTLIFGSIFPNTQASSGI